MSKRKYGKWIAKIKGGWREYYYCSKCNTQAIYQIINERWEFENYCPHCGAKMKNGGKRSQ